MHSCYQFRLVLRVIMGYFGVDLATEHILRMSAILSPSLCSCFENDVRFFHDRPVKLLILQFWANDGKLFHKFLDIAGT